MFILPKMEPDILLPKLGPIMSRNLVLTQEVDVTKLVSHHLEIPGPDSLELFSSLLMFEVKRRYWGSHAPPPTNQLQ